MKNTILIWGTGQRTKKYLNKAYFENCSVKGFVDTYKSEGVFMGYPVYSPNEISEIIDKIDYLVIANQYFTEILEICVNLKIEWNKIVITDYVEEPLFHSLFKRLEIISEPLYNAQKMQKMQLVKANEFDIADLNKLIGKDKYADKRYIRDYFRYRTFEYMATEIIDANVQGAVAEFGVFRGTFASMINEIFKNRKIYLFDTFEGFEKNEAAKEVAAGYCDDDFVYSHKQTSVEQMLKNMPHPEQCIICKGFFPESATQEAINEKYAFVSIDVDFEESSYQGLKFFYPRLSEGGAIFLHDYHTFFLEGVRKAVQRFECEFRIMLKKIPLADRAGTLVILK